MTLPSSSRPARFAGLDGLRAIAVALVIAYHLFPDWVFAGGFVGVDVFFVISGFLITTLLLAERDRPGSVSISGFWKRRVRRCARIGGEVLSYRRAGRHGVCLWRIRTADAGSL